MRLVAAMCVGDGGCGVWLQTAIIIICCIKQPLPSHQHVVCRELYHTNLQSYYIGYKGCPVKHSEYILWELQIS
jgi:hypothetical protein